MIISTSLNSLAGAARAVAVASAAAAAAAAGERGGKARERKGAERTVYIRSAPLPPPRFSQPPYLLPLRSSLLLLVVVEKK